jgi:hypothetical protein
VQFSVRCKAGETNIVPDADAVTVSEEVNATIVAFLESASRYFSSSLDTEIFKKRLEHVWENTGELSALSAGECQVTWNPAEVVMYPSVYKVVWNLADIQQPIANPGEASTVFEELPVLMEVDSESIPVSSDAAAAPMTEKERAMQKVRQARLRLAIAKLRAEKLAMRYFKKYGTLLDATGDSDTGDESDLEAAGGDAASFSDREILNALDRKI